MAYAKNYLKLVILQLKFDPILELADTNLAEFRNKIKDKLPRLGQGQELEVETVLSAKKSEENSEAKPEARITRRRPRWTFFAKDKSKQLTVADNHFTLEYKQYQDSKATEDDISFLWPAFKDIYDISLLNRVGLRYINEIEIPTGDPLTWQGYINDNIVAATLGAPETTECKLARSMHATHWVGDNHRIIFQFGIQNSDFPNPVAKKEFTLDYDCYSTGSTEVSGVIPCFRRYNLLIESLFEQSIGQQLRDLMNSSGFTEGPGAQGD